MEALFEGFVAHPLGLGTLFTQALFLVGFVLLIVAVKERPLAVAFSGQNVGGDPVKKLAVMADDHDRSGEFEQRVFQCPQSFHIQIV